MDPETETPGTKTFIRQRGGLLGKLLNGVANFLTIHVKMYVVVIGATVIALGGWAIVSRVEFIDAQQRATDAREASARAFAAELRAYDNAVNDRNDCLDRVTRSDLNRGQHEALVNAIESLFPESDTARVLVGSLRAGPLLASEPFTEAECPPVPPAPIPPPELAGTPEAKGLTP